MEYWDHLCSIWLKINTVHGVNKPWTEKTSTEDLKKLRVWPPARRARPEIMGPSSGLLALPAGSWTRESTDFTYVSAIDSHFFHHQNQRNLYCILFYRDSLVGKDLGVSF